jgi:hypothetical protein
VAKVREKEEKDAAKAREKEDKEVKKDKLRFDQANHHKSRQ